MKRDRMNDPRRGNEEERNQYRNPQEGPQGGSAQAGYNEESGEDFNDFNAEEDQEADHGRSGRQRPAGRYSEQAEGQDESEETDELEEGEEAAQDEDEQPGEGANWIDRVGDILTGKAEDVNYDKIARYASLAIVGFWGLRKGGLLGGLVASAALGLAAKSMGAMETQEEDQEQPEEEMEAEVA